MPAAPGETLALWEALASTTAVARGASVLVALGAADGLAEACRMPLATAARAALGELRDRAGPSVPTVLGCPECASVLDVPLALDGLLAAAAETRHEVVVDGCVVRSPTTEDLLIALASADPAAALRGRCVSGPGGPSEDLHDRVAAAAEELAGASALSVRLACPECGCDVSAEVDPVALLADRVADEVRDILSDVAELAAAFGWSEKEVLRLSDARRRAYLDLARAGGAR